jgi:hypothetical protein
VDGFAVFVLVFFEPTVGVVILRAIELQDASRELYRRMASPEDNGRKIVASRQENKGLNVVGVEKFLVFAFMLPVNPEAAVPRSGGMEICWPVCPR